MTRPSSLTACLLLFGCGPKAGTPTSSEEVAASAARSLGDQVPDDGTSQDFAKRLVALTISDHTAVDGDGVKLVYSSLSFEGEGTWRASGAVEVMDEKMECREGGSWTMSPAESAKVAAVEWTLDETSCAGREPGETKRAEVTLGKDDWTLRYR